MPKNPTISHEIPLFFQGEPSLATKTGAFPMAIAGGRRRWYQRDIDLSHSARERVSEPRKRLGKMDGFHQQKSMGNWFHQQKSIGNCFLPAKIHRTLVFTSKNPWETTRK